MLNKAQTVEEVNTAIARTGKRARLLQYPGLVKPVLFFVNIGKHHLSHQITDASCVSDFTIGEWLTLLKIVEVETTIDYGL
jgi:hypothetical protein